jgi:hypothetical protein
MAVRDSNYASSWSGEGSARWCFGAWVLDMHWGTVDVPSGPSITLYRRVWDAKGDDGRGCWDAVRCDDRMTPGSPQFAETIAMLLADENRIRIERPSKGIDDPKPKRPRSEGCMKNDCRSCASIDGRGCSWR